MRSPRQSLPLAMSLIAALALTSSWAAAQQPGPTAAAPPAPPAGVRWQTNLEQASKVAQQTQKLVLLHFWAPWCKNCLQMDSQVFNQPAVAAAIEQHYVPVKLNADQYRASAESYGVDSLPTDIVLSPNGQVITKFNSPTTASAYVTRMNQIALASRPRGSAVGAAAVPAANPYSAIGQSAVAPAAPVAGQEAAQGQHAQYAVPPVGSGNQPMQITNPHVPSQAVVAPANPAAGAAPQDRYAAQAPVQDRYATAPQDRYGTAANERYTAPAQDPASAAAAVAPPQDRYAAAAPQAQPAAAPAGAVIDPFANRQAATVGQGYGNNQFAPPPAVQNGPYGAPSPAAAPPAMAQRPQPTGAPTPSPSEFGLDGYCPVTLLESQRWVAGDRRFGAVHRGRTYLFTNPDAQKRFLANPDYYAPALSGVDPVLAIDQQQSVPGQRKHGVFYDNQVYLFSGEASLMRFSQNPQKYVEGVRQAMKAQDGRVLR